MGEEQDAELTQDEIRRLKKIAKEDERWEWLWAILRKFGGAVFALVAMLVAFRNDISELGRWLLGR